MLKDLSYLPLSTTQVPFHHHEVPLLSASQESKKKKKKKDPRYSDSGGGAGNRVLIMHTIERSEGFPSYPIPYTRHPCSVGMGWYVWVLRIELGCAGRLQCLVDHGSMGVLFFNFLSLCLRRA